MTDRPREIWCDTGLYWDYVEDWSEGSWRDNDDSGGEKYVRADRIEGLESKLAKLVDLVKRAFNEGVTEGMNEFRLQDGGNTWHDSQSRKRLAELTGGNDD